jgi:type IV pilus assembly protein PilB
VDAYFPPVDARHRGARLGRPRGALISLPQLEAARAAQQAQGGTLGSHLVRLGFLTERELVEFLSATYGVPAVCLEELEIDGAAVGMVPAEMANMYQVVPVTRVGEILYVAMSDPSHVDTIDRIGQVTGLTIHVVLAGADEIKIALSRIYAPLEGGSDL